MVEILIIVVVVHTWWVLISSILTEDFMLLIFVGVLPEVLIMIEVLMKFCVHLYV